jgi:hypothetical protein
MTRMPRVQREFSLNETVGNECLGLTCALGCVQSLNYAGEQANGSIDFS